MEHVDGGSLEQPYDAATKTWETLPESLVHRHFRELCKVPIYPGASCALHSAPACTPSTVPDSNYCSVGTAHMVYTAHMWSC